MGATRVQVTLSEELLADLKRESKKAGVSVPEFIRQSVTARLHKEAKRSWRDPFEKYDGLVNSDETDLAARIDEILYGAGVRR